MPYRQVEERGAAVGQDGEGGPGGVRGTDLRALAAIALLEGVGERYIASVAAKCTFEDVRKGNTVLQSEAASTDLYFVLSGRLVARGRSVDGREVTFATVSAGEVFGEFSAIDGRPRSAEILAVRDSRIARLPSAQLRDLVTVAPTIGLRLCELLVAKNREMSQRLFEFATMNVRDRIFRSLLRLAAANGNGNGSGHGESAVVDYPPTRYEIAIDAGTNRETVSREMAELVRREIVESSRARMVIDVPALSALAQTG